MKFNLFVKNFSSLLMIIICESKLLFKNEKNLLKGEECKGGTLSEDDKLKILTAHNEYRNQIALRTSTIGPRLPFAKDMLQMYWSDEIALKAQEWANKCKFKHTTFDQRQQPEFPTGESMYHQGSTAGYKEMNWQRPIDVWFDEIRSYGGKSIDELREDKGPMTGHFTQLIWAKSYLIGCGFSQYLDEGYYTNLYICQYGPLGNVLGMPVYVSSNDVQYCNCSPDTACGNENWKGLCCPLSHCTSKTIYYSGPVIEGTVPDSVKGM
jgi:hypothetical protein